MENDNFAHNQPVVDQEIKPIKWTLFIFVSALPLIGLIMLCIWAFGNDAKRARSNWAKGMLIYWVIALVISLIFFAIFGAAIMAAASSGDYGGY